MNYEGGRMKAEKPEGLKERTKVFALDVIRLYSVLPNTTQAQIIGKQLFRSATSVGAHFREAIRGRSCAEFISKVEVGLQELEESIYWMELLVEAEITPKQAVTDLIVEADELIAILVTCVKNAKLRKGRYKDEG